MITKRDLMLAEIYKNIVEQDLESLKLEFEKELEDLEFLVEREMTRILTKYLERIEEVG